MHDAPRQKLRELVVEYGRLLCDDPRRCEALFKDYCEQYKREIFILISALKNRSPFPDFQIIPYRLTPLRECVR